MDGTPAKHVVDAAAGVAAIASVLGWLPAVAALMSAIWYGIQICEYLRKRAK